MIYNELEHSLKPHPGHILVRTYDGQDFRGMVYLTEIFEKCGKKLDRPYLLEFTDFEETVDPQLYVEN